jgi:SAM-dependent methyltransferase
VASTFARIPFEACPLCGHEEADVLHEASCAAHPLYRRELPGTIRWVCCTGCRHVFTDGYFGPDALALLFSGANAAQLPGSEVGMARQTSARIVERVLGLMDGRDPEQASWLDVGFGNGSLLTTAAEFGFEAVGIDVREEPVRRLAELGFQVHRADMMAFAPERTFDVLSLADVLEHVPFPRPALAQARTLLAPGGLLFVSMPNRDSFNWQALDREGRNPYWGELEHLHNFGRAGLYALLRESGFEPVQYAVSQRYVAGMEILARQRA